MRPGDAQRAGVLAARVLEVVYPDIVDHVEAAEVRNDCRRRGVQVGTIDAFNRSRIATVVCVP